MASPITCVGRNVTSQQRKGEAFRALHERAEAFIIPNPWDIGTARLLEATGFEALATTGAGYAFSIGQKDGTVGRETMMEYVRQIVSATDLPVSADLESGFGDDPEVVAETIRLGAELGLVGASIEDVVHGHGRGERLYDQGFSVERIRAAAEEARKLPFTFSLTARCENYLIGNPDLDDTIKRLQAYQEAGADVLYAPGLSRLEDIKAIVSSVDRPVNVVVGLVGAPMSRKELSSVGVKRISLGSTLSRAALGEFLRAAAEMKEHGTFTFAEAAVAYPKLNAMFS
jgi:2-methylisocitrate lyase-like PEP mutase family enzyme